MDEEIGIFCKQCGHIIKDIKDCDPEFVSWLTYFYNYLSLFTCAYMYVEIGLLTFDLFISIFVEKTQMCAIFFMG